MVYINSVVVTILKIHDSYKDERDYKMCIHLQIQDLQFVTTWKCGPNLYSFKLKPE
jgi:hypothetical protein